MNDLDNCPECFLLIWDPSLLARADAMVRGCTIAELAAHLHPGHEAAASPQIGATHLRSAISKLVSNAPKDADDLYQNGYGDAIERLTEMADELEAGAA